MTERNGNGRNGWWKIALTVIMTALISSATTIIVTYGTGIGELKVAQAQQIEKAASLSDALKAHESQQMIERRELMDTLDAMRTDIRDLTKAVYGRAR
jgi:hypothetical protein